MLPENPLPPISMLPEKDILNIALLPVDEDINRLFYEAAQPFAGRDAGYCLNAENALAHVTLTHFRHEDQAEAAALVKPHLGKTVTLGLDRIYLNPYPVPGHAHAFWVGLSTSRNPELIALQAEIAATLRAGGCEPLTALGERFHPHFTLLLLDPGTFPETGLLLSLLQDMVGRKIECAVRLGASNQIGEFQKIIASSSV